MTGKTNAGSGAQVFYLGTGTSFDVSNVPGYQNLTKDNFIVEVNSVSSSFNGDWAGTGSSGNSFSFTPTKTYNASTGQLTITRTSGSASGSNNGWAGGNTSGSASVSVSVYLVKGNIKQL